MLFRSGWEVVSGSSIAYRAFRFIVRRCAEASGAILRPQSPSGSDRTHCLLAASPARQRELRIDLAELLGKSLRVYASPR